MRQIQLALGLSTFLAAVVALGAGCASSDDDAGGCEVGSQRSCEDANGCSGLQSCGSNGTFTACVCGGGGSGGSGAVSSGGAAQGGTAGAGQGGTAGSAQGGTGGSAQGGSAQGGSAQGGNGGTASTAIGATCVSTADCGTGFLCLNPGGTEFDGQGVGNGLCTQDCTSDASLCGAGSVCLSMQSGSAFCFEGCTVGSQPFDTWDGMPWSHCHGRPDMACLTNTAGTPDDPSDDVAYCNPACVTDQDCAGGFCDESTGACASAAPTGQAIGSACDPAATNDPCAGFCALVDQTNPNQGFCSGICSLGTFGITGGCDSNPTQGQAQTGACVFGTEATSEVGDLGLCTGTCDCTANCAPGLLCAPVPVDTATFIGAAGLCVGTLSAGETELTTCP